MHDTPFISTKSTGKVLCQSCKLNHSKGHLEYIFRNIIIMTGQVYVMVGPVEILIQRLVKRPYLMMEQLVAINMYVFDHL